MAAYNLYGQRALTVFTWIFQSSIDPLMEEKSNELQVDHYHLFIPEQLTMITAASIMTAFILTSRSIGTASPEAKSYEYSIYANIHTIVVQKHQ